MERIDEPSRLVLDDVTAAVRMARSFLVGAQLKNGRWLDFRYEKAISSHWVTAYVARSLIDAGGAEPACDKACTYLIANEMPGGGWAFSRANPADGDSTANVLDLLARARGKELREASIERVAKALLRFRDASSGGFHTYRADQASTPSDPLLYAGSGWCNTHASVTAMAGCALYFADRERHGSLVEAGARFVALSQSDPGFWEDYWWDGRTYGTYCAAHLLSLAGSWERVARACTWLLAVQQPCGGWGNGMASGPTAFHTALAVSTLLLDPEHRFGAATRRGVCWMLRAQLSDGSWPSAPILRMPRPDVQSPWDDPQGGHLLPVLTDHNRLFTTATALTALVAATGGV